MRCVVGATLPGRDRDYLARGPLGPLVAAQPLRSYDRRPCSAPDPDRCQSRALARERVRRQELHRGPGPHRHPGGGVGTGRPAGHDHHRRRIADMSGIDACRLLHSELRIGHTVPTLILTPNKPTPEQRVAALRTGVWDFLLYPPDPEELLLSLETYLQAKRNIDVALAGLVDPATGLHTRPALARRARELG